MCRRGIHPVEHATQYVFMLLHVVRLLTLLATMAVLSLAAGCSASSAPPAGFVENRYLLYHDPRIPFQEVWLKPGVDLTKYKKILVRPVDSSHLLQSSWWAKVEPSQLFSSAKAEAAARVLSQYMEKELIRSFARYPEYEIVEEPGPETLVVETALVEVVPTKVWLNMMGYVAIGALDTGTTAIEGRLRNGESNEDLFLFKDRRRGQYAIVSLSDFQWYAHARRSIRRWAYEIVEVCHSRPGAKIPSRWPITLRPW